MIYPHISHLSFSGGGLCGLSYLGIIRFLQTERLTHSIKNVAGTSMGSFFACSVALDIPYAKLETLIKNHFKNGLFYEANKMLNIIHTLGIDDGETLVAPLRLYIRDTYDQDDITFIELTKRTGKNLVICATCVETAKPMYFCLDTTPHVGILQAVQASMTVPLFARPMLIQERHYVDGGLTDNHPITYFGNPPPASLLAVKISADVSVPSDVMTSLPSYISTLFSTLVVHADKEYQRAKWCIMLKDPPVEFMPMTYSKEGLSLDVSEKDIDASIAYGYMKAQEWFTSTSVPGPED
jgi:predicted acylesterase/phospholipase RssA